MAVITLRDYLYDDFGNGVGGIRVRAYGQNLDGTIPALHVAETFTQSGSGKWELANLDTTNSPAGIFNIELYNPSTEQIRWRRGDIALQVDALIGQAGTAPLSAGSISGFHVADGSLTGQKLTVAERTINDTLAMSSNTGSTLTEIISALAYEIKRIKNTATWRTAPAFNLSQAVKNGGTITEIRSGSDAGKGTGSAGVMYIATDTQIIYRHSGSSWVKIAVGSYDNIDDKPSSINVPNAFGKVQAGSTLLTADSTQDTLTVKAGSGIAITANSGSDEFTISATTTGTTASHTHPGSDITSAVNDSDSLTGVTGNRFPYIHSNINAASSGSSLGSSDFKMQAGSVNTYVSNGLGTVELPTTVVGYVSIIAINGDYDAYSGHIMLKDSYAGSDARFTFRTSTSVSQTIRVNYIAIYW
jgi:hypothetical protein